MKRLAVAVLLVSGCCLSPVWAAEPVPDNQPALARRLAAYDPRAVAAARHYFEQPMMKTNLNAMVDNMTKAMSGVIAQQNPGLSPEKSAQMRGIVGDALKERLDLIVEMDMVVALDTFSADELVALDRFYSSPEGAGILAKMPRMMAQLPAMMKAVMPGFLADVQAKVKQNGAELKL